MTGQNGQTRLDCWNSIGVRGDRSCDRLAVHTHCRNCDVHTAGAQQVMQRPLPAGYREEWAEYFAREEIAQKELDRSALVFRVGSEWLALPAALAETVADPARPHRIPRRSGGVLNGIVNVKGRLYPCMSLNALMSIGDTQLAQESRRRAYPRLLVLTLQQLSFAIPVDDMFGIHRYARSELQAVPTTVNKGVHRYLTDVLPVGEMRVGCLDAELVGFKFAVALK